MLLTQGGPGTTKISATYLIYEEAFSNIIWLRFCNIIILFIFIAVLTPYSFKLPKEQYF
jgi:ABC-type sugar transport system permease subunit